MIRPTLHLFSSPLASIRTLKVLIWLGACLPLLRLLVLAVTDDLGANPVEFIERSTGTWALVFLLLSLTITPLRLWKSLSWLIAVRRLLGLWMFAYACVHVLSYLWLDYSFDWQDIGHDIVKHPFVLVGACAFLLTLPLAATSNQRAIRALKQRWKRLHMLVYVIAVLALLHYWWLVKKDVTEPVIYSLVFAGLMLARWRSAFHQRR
jgi:methionine sulfoxide reductase heme-binding subunit